MPYILDTDWTIHALGGRSPYAETVRRLEPSGLAISWVTVGEVKRAPSDFLTHKYT